MFANRILTTLHLATAAVCVATSPAAASSPTATGSPAVAASPAAATGSWPAAAGSGPAVFQTWRPGAQAITYDVRAVPPGATAQVQFSSTGHNLWVRLEVTGLVPGRAYGAHMHVAECGRDPKAAGPHYQHQHDPAATTEKPSADPRYANPANEIWLDFTADARGAAVASREQRWMVADDRMPRSLVLHAETTRTGPGVAGTAGARVGCLKLPFGYGHAGSSRPQPPTEIALRG
jgi:superoxide dismutase, Cu-Zn family